MPGRLAADAAGVASAAPRATLTAGAGSMARRHHSARMPAASTTRRQRAISARWKVL